MFKLSTVIVPDVGGIAALAAAGGTADRHAGYLAQQTAEGARARAPRKTGKLQGAVRVGRDDQGWYVIADTEYASAVNRGTKPHEIRPKNASVLRFPTKGGRIVYARSVAHPGTAPNPFLLDALRDVIR